MSLIHVFVHKELNYSIYIKTRKECKRKKKQRYVKARSLEYFTQTEGISERTMKRNEVMKRCQTEEVKQKRDEVLE